VNIHPQPPVAIVSLKLNFRLTPIRSIYFPDGSILWASQWNRLTDQHRVFCVPVGTISLRIPTIGLAFDGAVKLVHGGGVAFSGSGHLVYGDGDSYSGEFSCGKRHGWGEILHADGSKLRCHWAGDLPVDAHDISTVHHEQQRLLQLQRGLCDWVSALLATASVSPLSRESMRARAEACELRPPVAPPAISDAALTNGKARREAEVLLVQRMSSELTSLRKQAGDSQLLSHSIEMQRNQLESASNQLELAQSMQSTLRNSLAMTDQQLRAALAALSEAQAREQKLIQDVSAASAESSALKTQLSHQQNLLDSAQGSISHLKTQVCRITFILSCGASDCFFFFCARCQSSSWLTKKNLRASSN
jgi:hypothetical protein